MIFTINVVHSGFVAGFMSFLMFRYFSALCIYGGFSGLLFFFWGRFSDTNFVVYRARLECMAYLWEFQE